MSRGRLWSPRCCLVCGEPLEEWKWPLEPECYIHCFRCAVLYVVTDEGLERVVLAREPEEFRLALEQLVAHWWSSHDPVTQTAASRAAA